MTILSQPAPAKVISDRLLTPLRQIVGRSRILSLLRGILYTAFLAGSVWLIIALVLGSYPALPLWSRLALSFVAWVILLFSLARFIVPAIRRRNLAQAARLIDTALPDDQERISSAIELTQEPDSPHKGSPELLAALVLQAERDAANVDPNAVVSSRGVTYAAAACLPVALIWIAAAAVYPTNVTQGLARILQPWTESPPLISALLTIDPGDIDLPQGKTLDITVSVAPSPHAPNGGRNFSVSRAAITSTFATGPQVAELERTGPLTFRTRIENVQQSFTYVISADDASSRTFHVTVAQLPALVSTDVTYTYPAYTKLPPKTEIAAAGNLTAVIGTRARLTFHVTQDLDPKSGLVFQIPRPSGPPAQNILPLGRIAENTYTLDMPLLESGTYSLSLLNEKGAANSNFPPRTVTVVPDLPPTIDILAPQNHAHIRPTDTANIKFRAGDDIGLDTIEILVKADNARQEVIRIPFHPAADANPFTGTYALSMPDTLRAAGIAPASARQVAYQLRVTDNADPRHDPVLSISQMLDLDPTAGTTDQQKDTSDAKDLSDAATKAAAASAEEQTKIDAINKSDKALTTAQKADLAKARSDLEQTLRNLAAEADKKRDSNFSPIAQELKDVGEKNLSPAANDIAEANLDTTPAARKESLQRASNNLTSAQQRLGQIQNQLADASNTRNAINTSDDLARRQKELSDKMAADPANADKYRQQQKDLLAEAEKQRQQLLAANPSLQNSAETTARGKNSDLAKRVDPLAGEQEQLNQYAQTQAEAANADQKLADLKQEQTQWNKDLQTFADKNKDTLAKWNVPLPDKNRVDAINKDLTPSKMGEAQRAQENAANQLDRAADRLDTSSKTADRAAGNAERNAAKAAENAKAADDLKTQADKFTADAAAAKVDNKPNSPANANEAYQKARVLSRDIRGTAQNIINQNPAQRQAVTDIQKTATDAESQAQAGKLDAAQTKFTDAAAKLKKLADDINTQAQQAASTAPAQSARDAAQQAKDLADRQHDLADDTARLIKSVDQAAADKPKAEEIRQRQLDLAGKLDKAAQDAQKLALDNHTTAPESARAADAAAKELSQAAHDQKSAAQSGSPQQSAQIQQTSESHTNQALSSLGGQPHTLPTTAPATRRYHPPATSNPSPGTTANPGNSTPPAPATTNSAATTAGSPTTAGSNTPATHPAGSAPATQKSSDTKPSSSAQNNNDKPGSEKPGDPTASNKPGGEKPGGDPTASNKPSGEKPGDPTASNKPGSEKPGDPTASNKPGGEKPGDPHSSTTVKTNNPSADPAANANTPGHDSVGENKPGGNDSGTGSADLLAKADKQYVDAIEAQKRAADSGDPVAAAKAARDFQQATQSLRQAADAANGSASSTHSQPGKFGSAGGDPSTNGQAAGNGASTGKPGAPNGDTQGNVSQSPAAATQLALAGSGGAGENPAAGDTTVPDAARQIGIAPGDWARLSPDLKTQLLTAAQQKGPPAYREAIKDYYIRIARMKTTE